MAAIVIDREKCIGCRACVDICPFDALSMEGDIAVVNDKCLECHRELRTRIKAGTGFHGPLAGRQCVECHKEHLGRSFKLVRFDRSTYDHGRLGFPLAGKHARLDCERCHTPEFRKAADVRQNPALLSSKTFLGLSRECVACHKGIQGTEELHGFCITCHEKRKDGPRICEDYHREEI